jgi:hypothetical protein
VHRKRLFLAHLVIAFMQAIAFDLTVEAPANRIARGAVVKVCHLLCIPFPPTLQACPRPQWEDLMPVMYNSPKGNKM